MGVLSSHIEDFLTWRKREGLAPKTITNMRGYLAKFDTACAPPRLSRLSSKDVDRWALVVAEMSPASRVSNASTIRGFLTWAHNENRAPDLARHVPRYRLPKTLPRAQSHDAVQRLWAVLPDDRARLIVGLMLWSGLRVGEVVGLEVGDCDLSAGWVRVCGKGGHERIVPVPAATLELLRDQIAAVSNGPLIRSRVQPERGVSSPWLSTMVSGWWKQAGIKRSAGDGINAHALRHTAASAVLDSCKDVTIVQRMLGHARLATTSVYLRTANMDDLKGAIEAAAA